MIIKRPKNTKERGLVEFFVYPENHKFIGVCLTFDIIEEGNNPEEVMESIKEAALLHLKVVIRENLSDTLLNRHAPKKYWDKYFAFHEMLKRPRLSQRKSVEATQLTYNPSTIEQFEPVYT